MRKDPKIEFYRGDAVHNVLKRYVFSDDEKRIIQAAILTAKRDKPNMLLINKADTLLKECAANRQEQPTPAEETINTAKAIAQAKLAQYKEPNPWTAPRKANAPMRWAYGLVTAAILYAILGYAMKHHGKYSHIEAQEKCQEKGQVLPLTLGDFFDSGYRFGQPTEFWLADGQVMSPHIGRAHAPEDEDGYSYICVNENGKKDTIPY